ncbi:MAG: hypothetical protein ACKVOJ_12025 [Sphingomonadaceae bacterium]
MVDPATRSRMMGGIRTRTTRPEMPLRRACHVLGFSFRLHAKLFPGKPDVIPRKHRAVILLNGCFWLPALKLPPRLNACQQSRVLGR